MPDGLSAALRANLTALQKIASDMGRDTGRVQNRLATGQQANTASDNPATHVTASSLNARAAALNSVLDGISNGKRTIETAIGGLENIQSLLGNMRSLADQALSSPSTLAKVSGSVTGLTAATVVSLDSGETITVSDGKTTVVYSHALAQDVQALIAAVNATANLDVKARLGGDGRMQLEATDVNNVIIGGSASVGELSAIGLSAGTTTSTSNSVRQALAQQFDTVRTQIDQLAADAGFNGQNLLAGSTLVIGLNDTGDAAATISGSAVTAAGLGIGVASGVGGDFQFDGDIQELIANLDLASASLQQMSSSYSEQLSAISVREDFTKGVSSLLTDGAERLVESNINEEAATLLALQTRRDLSGSSLSLAAESDKAMLRLFGSS